MQRGSTRLATDAAIAATRAGMSLVGLLAAVSGRYFALVEFVETELQSDVLRNAEMQSTGIHQAVHSHRRIEE